MAELLTFGPHVNDEGGGVCGPGSPPQLASTMAFDHAYSEVLSDMKCQDMPGHAMPGRLAEEVSKIKLEMLGASQQARGIAY